MPSTALFALIFFFLRFPARPLAVHVDIPVRPSKIRVGEMRPLEPAFFSAASDDPFAVFGDFQFGKAGTVQAVSERTFPRFPDSRRSAGRRERLQEFCFERRFQVHVELNVIHRVLEHHAPAIRSVTEEYPASRFVAVDNQILGAEVAVLRRDRLKHLSHALPCGQRRLVVTERKRQSASNTVHDRRFVFVELNPGRQTPWTAFLSFDLLHFESFSICQEESVERHSVQSPCLLYPYQPTCQLFFEFHKQLLLLHHGRLYVLKV